MLMNAKGPLSAASVIGMTLYQKFLNYDLKKRGFFSWVNPTLKGEKSVVLLGYQFHREDRFQLKLSFQNTELEKPSKKTKDTLVFLR